MSGGGGVPFGNAPGGPFAGAPGSTGVGTPPGVPSQRTIYVPPMGGALPSQLTDPMNGQMAQARGMVGMGGQMGQSYATNMQNQMANMSGMAPQTMSVGSSTPSPNQNVPGMGMQTSMVPNPNMAGSSMGSGMTNTGMVPGMGISSGGMSNVPTNPNQSIQNTLNQSMMGGNNNISNNQNTAINNQANQVANQPQQNKEFNTASLCRFGQETVQDIVSRTQEVFQTLKAIQPPNGTAQGASSSNDKKAKIQEQLRTIRLLFKRLRLIYEKCNENCQVPGMEYTHIESLIPLKEEYEHKTIDEKKTSEAYKIVCEENKELTEQVVLKNKQLKEVINNLRTIIWEINVMLTMRRS